MIGSGEQRRGAGTSRQVGVPRSAARVLAACAAASELCPELPLFDTIAPGAFERLGGYAGDFKCSELRSTAFRTFVIDCLARDFFDRTPGGRGVGLWSLLSTRAHRLVDFPWVDVDVPDVAKLRQFVLPPRRGWVQLSTCLCDPAWIERACAGEGRKRLFVLDESVLPMPSSALTLVLDQVSARAAPGSELVLAFDSMTPVRPASPLRRSSALEMVSRETSGAELVARYPRLRFVDGESYSGDLGSNVAGVNAVATLQGGVGAPALAHLRVI